MKLSHYFSATFLNMKFSRFDKYLKKYNYVNVGLEKGASDSIEQRIVNIKEKNKPRSIINYINSVKGVLILIMNLLINY